MAATLGILPPELLLLIAPYLDLPSLNYLVQSSRYFRNLLNPMLWSLMNHSTTLVWAASRRSWSLVAYTLSHGADPLSKDKRCQTALHWAANHGHGPTATALIDAGADVDAISIGDSSPLEVAALRGHTGVANILLDRGASTDMTLARACAEGNAVMAKILLERGTRVDRSSGLYDRLLVMAVKQGRAEIARQLCKWGANLEKRVNDGRTVKDFAIMRGIDLRDVGKEEIV